MAERRNVLFVVIDQLRADCVHGALADHVDLPNLRSLMSEGVSFHNHFSVTSPCGPSRASLLTGQYAMNHRSVRNGTPLPHDTPNLATEARKVGYVPLLYGYSDTTLDPRLHDPADPALHSYEQPMPGFVEALEMRLEESWPWRAHLAAKGYDVPPFPDIFRPDGPNPDDPALYRAEDSDTAFLTDRAMQELYARPCGWFAHLTYLRPHPPLVAPAPFNRLVDPRTVPPPDNPEFRAQHPFLGPARDTKPLATNVEGFPDLPDTPENVAMLRALYLGLAAEVDHQLGRLFAMLKESGVWDRTLIVVTADHGEMLGDFGLWGKMTFHDAAFAVPLILRDPGRPAGFGQIVDRPTESVDLAPTLLELIGAGIPDTMDGASLVPFLDGGAPNGWREDSFSELDFGNPVTPTLWQKRFGLDSRQANLCILRSATHTLVHFNGGLPPLLYCHDDPTRDLSGQPDAQPLLRALLSRMLDRRMTKAQGRFAHIMVTPDGVIRES